jgi:predicted kinase
LGSSPELDAVFKNPEEREAARNFLDLMQER